MSTINYRIRAAIALLLIVGITCQLYLFINQSNYIFTTDQAIEKLVQVDPFDDNHVNLDEFIPDNLIVPLLVSHLQLTKYNDSYFSLANTSSHSIRSPPYLS